MNAGAHDRSPVEVISHQMAEAKLARMSADWTAFAHARDAAIHLVLTHRIGDEVSRYRQVTIACTGYQDLGDDARERIHKRLAEAFSEGVDRSQSAHDVIVRMMRIPRAAAAGAFVQNMRHGDGEICITFLLSEDGRLPEDIRRRFGDDPARIAKRFTERDWASFASPLLVIQPGEPRPELMDAARQSLRRVLDALG